MTRDERILEMEERFWMAGPEFYREHLDPRFRMAFPGMGVVDRDAAIAGLSGAARWRAVEIGEPRVVELSPDAVVLCYHARAERDGEPPYAALASSAYARRDGAWKLAFHQQSPTG